MMHTRPRVAVVVSHPIQHFCPQYASWAALGQVDLHVFFASRHGLVPYLDKHFGQLVQWNGLRLDFPHKFLNGNDDIEISVRTDAITLDDELARFDPDALVCYGYAQAVQRRAVRWARAKDVPVFMISDSDTHQLVGAIRAARRRLVLPLIYRGISLFLTVGDSNEDHYRAHGVCDLRFVRMPFPVDVIDYDVKAHLKSDLRAALRRRLGVPMDHKVVLSVGKLVPWKRHADLVRLSNDLYGDGRAVTVVLVGAGPDEAALRKLAVREGVGGVIFAGFVPPAELVDYYFAADLYVQCSDMDRHPLSVSEAVYCGLPVVLSDRCGSYGPTDDVRQGMNGYVYRCADITELRRASNRILSSDVRGAVMGAASARIGADHQRLAHGEALLQALEIVRVRHEC